MAIIGTQVTSYNSFSPIHGGKLRAKEIRKIFELALEGKFQELNTFEKLPLKNKSEIDYGSLPFLEDLKIADELSLGLDIDLNTKYILVEQPWGWPLVHTAKKKNKDLLTVYSSHNIESTLKSSILPMIDSAGRRLSLQRILELELLAANESDLVISCSISDTEWFVSAGVPEEKILYIPNCTGWNRKVDQLERPSQQSKYFTVVGSAYPPTIDSFLEIFWEAEIWLPPNVEIRVIGGIAEALSKFVCSSQASDLRGAINLLGVLDEEKLFDQLLNATGYLLPVKYGGGTNLKTAEALFFNKYTIGTEAAFRGFENYLMEPNNIVIDDNLGAMKAVWNACNQSIVSGERHFRDELTWDFWGSKAIETIKGKLQ